MTDDEHGPPIKVKRPNPAPPGPDLSTAIFHNQTSAAHGSPSRHPWPQEAHADLGLVDDDQAGS